MTLLKGGDIALKRAQGGIGGIQGRGQNFEGRGS